MLFFPVIFTSHAQFIILNHFKLDIVSLQYAIKNKLAVLRAVEPLTFPLPVLNRNSWDVLPPRNNNKYSLCEKHWG